MLGFYLSTVAIRRDVTGREKCKWFVWWKVESWKNCMVYIILLSSHSLGDCSSTKLYLSVTKETVIVFNGLPYDWKHRMCDCKQDCRFKSGIENSMCDYDSFCSMCRPCLKTEVNSQLPYGAGPWNFYLIQTKVF